MNTAHQLKKNRKPCPSLLSRLVKREASLVEIDMQWKRWRFGVFAFAAVLSLVGSRPGIAAVWIGLAGLGWIAFVGLVVLHSRFRRTLARQRVRIELEKDFDAIRELTPRRSTVWVLDGLSDRELRLNRDLDLFQTSGAKSGFSQLFPFFLTDTGALRFRDRILKTPESIEQVRARQSSIQFWAAHRLLRRKFFRLLGGAQSSLSAGGLVSKAQLPVVSGDPKRWAFVGLVLQMVFWSVWLAAQNEWLPAGTATIALLSWIGGFFWISRSVDFFGAYPQAMGLASHLRAVSGVTAEVERLNREMKSGFILKSDLAGIVADSPAALLREIEKCAGAMGIRQNPLLALIVNVLVPWDLYWATRYEIVRRKVSDRIETWLSEVAELEVQLALAEWDDHHGVCHPVVRAQVEGEAVRLVAKDLSHPMLPIHTRVANSLDLGEARLHLITGSNMAGKSTFLRAVALNQLLAQAGARVVATSMVTSVFEIETSIKPGDSLSDGYSAFYAEVKDLAQILKSAAQSTHTVLYFIDEIFRGTNNRERRSGAEAVIRAITQTRAIGFLTTHDLDLAALDTTVQGVENHHFRDDIQDGRMVFSYRYLKGPCPTTNATRVMAEAGLPVD